MRFFSSLIVIAAALEAVNCQLSISAGASVKISANFDSEFRSAIKTTIRNQFIAQSNYVPPQFDLISYIGVASSPTYFAKVQLSDVEYAHLRIFRPLALVSNIVIVNQYRLVAYLRGKTLSDVLVAFQNGDAIPEPTTTEVPAAGGVVDGNMMVDERAELEAAVNSTIKEQFSQMAGFVPEVFQMLAYSNQVVAGTNYFIKVRINDSDNECAHLKVFKPLPFLGMPMKLEGYIRGKSVQDPIEPFQPELTPPRQPGNWSNVMQADQLAVDLVAAVRADFEARVQAQRMFNAISYKASNLGGVVSNYVIKVQTDSNVYAHLFVSKAISTSANTVTVARLVAFQAQKTAVDELVVFLNVADQLLTRTVAEVNGIVSASQSASIETQAMVKAVFNNFLQAAGRQSANVFVAVSQRLQLGLSLVRYVKVQTSSNAYAHLKIVGSSSSNAQLVAFQANKSFSDSIELF